MTNRQDNIDTLLDNIIALPDDFHAAGVMTGDTLRTIARIAQDMHVEHTVETGCGKSTLLFSHLSPSHTVFALDMFGDFDVGSMAAVQGSGLFRSSTTKFVVGPTQKTLPQYEFNHPIDIALIDGPHGYPFPELEYYYFYPHLRQGGLLIVDDVHIPSIARMFDFLKEDEMYELVEVSGFTAFFRRTDAAVFNPYGDDWWLQGYNANRRQGMNEAAIRALQPYTNDKIEINSDGSQLRYLIYRMLRAVFGKNLADRVRNGYRAFRETG